MRVSGAPEGSWMYLWMCRDLGRVELGPMSSKSSNHDEFSFGLLLAVIRVVLLLLSSSSTPKHRRSTCYNFLRFTTTPATSTTTTTKLKLQVRTHPRVHGGPEVSEEGRCGRLLRGCFGPSGASHLCPPLPASSPHPAELILLETASCGLCCPDIHM